MKKHIQAILKTIGENPDREGLKKTPERVSDAYKFLTSGYRINPKAVLNKAIFTEKYNEMVLIKDIDFYSLCEHHLLPFYGRCHVAYIPNGKIIGLSKIPRIVEIFSRRLQVQERFTVEIAETIQDAISPKGVGVVVEAFHLCMAMRGVQKQKAYITTSSMLGAFMKDARTRSEFLSLIQKNFQT